MRDTRAIGDHWEAQAARYLADNGLTLVERHFSSRFGEIDLIMLDRDVLVFVEVRFRTVTGAGYAAETVTAHKQRRLVRTAEFFLLRHPEWRSHAARFDVVAFDRRAGTDEQKPTTVNWLRDAFRCPT